MPIEIRTAFHLDPHPQQVPSLDLGGVRVHLELVFQLSQRSHNFPEWILDSAYSKRGEYLLIHTNLILEPHIFFDGKWGMVDRIRALLSLTPWFPWLVPDLFWVSDFYTLVCFTSQEHLWSCTLRLLLWNPAPHLPLLGCITSACQVFPCCSKIGITMLCKA